MNISLPRSPPKGPAQSHRNRNRHRGDYKSQRNQPPAPSNAEWKQWPSVKARIPNLPHGTTTWDIQKNLSQFGNLDYIKIGETRQGDFAPSAIVTFKPPPRTKVPWEPPYSQTGVEFRTKRAEIDPATGKEKEVIRNWKVFVNYVKQDPPPTTYIHPVHGQPAVTFPTEMTIRGQSLDFGYLKTNTSMTVMKSVQRQRHQSQIRLALNPSKKELTISFPFLINSVNQDNTPKQVYRQYRFHIALNDPFFICQSTCDSKTSLILHVKTPPWYSRKLQDAMQLSHDLESFTWNIEDTWSRQTDIVDEKSTIDKINRLPISIRKELNAINIARWTTFRFTLLPKEETQSPMTLDHFLKALEAFNVHVRRDDAFNFEQGQLYEAPLWDVLDAGDTVESLTDQMSALSLSFELRYQLEVCITRGWLNEYLIGQAFLQKLIELPERRAKQILIHVDAHQQRVYDPCDIFEDLRYLRPVRASTIPPYCVEVYSATVTATGIVLHTPTVEIANRVIRKYQRHADRFLRVRFEDDVYRGQARLYPSTNKKMINVFKRVYRTMKHGIVIAGRHYQFLAWGNSQLRDHATYFFAPTSSITIDTIRESMGTFDHEKVVAKRAARMGQCFSTTRAISLITPTHEWSSKVIGDIVSFGYTFTDGVGKISPFAAELIKQELKHPGPAPSAYQFRLAGCKGVLAIDKSLTGLDMRLRPSQFKFESSSTELEIIRVSVYSQSTLNRQLILVLSSLGVPDHVFLNKQKDCIEALNKALVDDAAAIRALRENVDPNLATLSISTLVEHGFRRTKEPFVSSLLQLYRAWTLKYLKEKAKIPIAKGAFVLGVVDETQTLRGHVEHTEDELDQPLSQDQRKAMLPQIFLQYTDPATQKRKVVEGVCFLARNPSLHRGDVRVVMAVDNPQLRHMCDVVVMPCIGDRDLPSMCSGGDLDGDDYVVCWDPEMIPQEWSAKAFHYDPPTPVTRDIITNDDIINFFCDYLQNDYLGRIAHAHLAAADFLDEGICSKQCLDLLALHSMAVDYPKTGVPARLPRALERNKWPHFMEKRGIPYQSKKILGKLYDAVEKVNYTPELSDAFDPRILKHPPQDAIVGFVKELKLQYDQSMQRVMTQHEIQTEFEVWSTFVMSHSKAFGDFKFHEEIGNHSKTLKEQYYDAFCTEAGSREFAKLAPYAVAAYHVTHTEVKTALEAWESEDASEGSDEEEEEVEITHPPFISFPWILQEVLEKVAKCTLSDEELNELEPAARVAYETTFNEAKNSGDDFAFWTLMKDFDPHHLVVRELCKVNDEEAAKGLEIAVEVNEVNSGTEESEAEAVIAVTTAAEEKDIFLATEKMVETLILEEKAEQNGQSGTVYDFGDDDDGDFTY
ncbi:hypothetical protein B0A52_04196 [Exophiala mesophila]|uniref:RNA-dependent RNA polymerase n=1 Tax=Exophiala mesophila TaxID=212818 RepID=A0A438N813_EXOME|nr:hypothetical protein B0A52_04196 [Exophiala mesophila]